MIPLQVAVQQFVYAPERPGVGGALLAGAQMQFVFLVRLVGGQPPPHSAARSPRAVLYVREQQFSTPAAGHGAVQQAHPR